MMQENKVNKVLVCEDEIIILSSGQILNRLSANQISMAVPTFFSQYFLMDLKYPSVWWGTLMFLQYIFFGETTEEDDVEEPCKGALLSLKKDWKEFINFKNSGEDEDVLSDD